MATLLLGTTIGGYAAIHAGNIGSQSVNYANTSGSTTGSAGSVVGLTLNSSANGINPDNVTQNQLGYNTSVSLFGQTDGGLYSSAYNSNWVHQIYGDFRTGQIAVRGKNSGTWQGWRRILDETNFSSWAATAAQGTKADTAFGWGNHASAGYATTSYVTTQIANLVASAPAALDTLNELAAALGNDANFSTTITNSIATKLPLAGGTMTGNINWGVTDRGLTWGMNTDGAYIKFFNTGDGDTDSRLEYATSDNGDEYHRWVISGVERMNLKTVGLSVNGIIYSTSYGDSTQWNTAYSWGNHAGLYSSITHTHTFASLTSKPTTIAGYSISDAYTQTQIQNFFSGTTAITGYSKSNWDTAYTNRITSLTTTGSSGAATLVSNVLNIPNYTLAGLGGQPALSGTGFVKISGTTISYDNSTYLTGITSALVTNALGFTPYNATNPNGYITSSGNTSGSSGSVSGVTSSQIIYGDNSTGSTGLNESSLNTALKSGFYTVSNASLGYIPNATSVNFLMHTAYYSAGNLAGFDLLVNDSTTSNLYFRPATGAGKGNWQTVLTSQNYTSYAASSTHNHDGTYVPVGRTITINGTSYDLSANRSWTVSGSDSTKLPLAGGTMSGTIVLASISGTDQMVENTYGAYLHLGGWGIGRTDAAAVLVNTAYRADYADSLFDMNISRFTNNSGYVTSSGSVAYATSATRLYASDSPYRYGDGAPYYLYMNYDGGSYWELKVSPATPGTVRVAYANSAGSAGSASTSSQVTINYNNDSNSTYQLLWGSGNSVYGTSQVYVNPYSDVIYARGGYISPGNPWGTADSAYFPNGITTAGSDNWIYGHTYIGNAPGNGNGHEFWADGSMRSTRHHYLDANYGQTIVGRYSSTVYQGVWAMGDSYKLPIDGSTTGSLYGLAWSHPNAGGVAGNLNTHGLLVMENGTFLAAISGNIKSRDSIISGAHVYATSGYFYGSGSIRCGDMWGGAGLYRPSGSMVFGIENSDWIFSKGAVTQAYFGGGDGNLWMRWAGDWLSNLLAAKAVHRGEGSNYVDYSRYVYNNGAYSGSGWIEPSDLGVRYANSAGYASSAGSASNSTRADMLNGYGAAYGDTHPGHGLRVWYDWAYSGTYRNGITIGSHPGDTYYGWQIFQNMWDDRTYTRRYNGGFQSTYTLMTLQHDPYAGNMNQYVRTYDGPTFSDVYLNGWFRNNGNNTGLYNQSNGNHFYSNGGGSWAITGNGGNVELQFRSNHQSTLRGYVYGDTSSNFGLLNDQGGWSVRCYSGGGYGGYLSGSWTASGDLVAYSDARVKENVETIENALSKILSMRGVTYNRTDIEDKSKKVGVIAQEVQAILPEVVTEQQDGMLGVSYGNIVGVLIEAIKEQQKEIEVLKSKLN